MIHDAQVQVSCDGKHCREEVWIIPEVVFSHFDQKEGTYDCRDSSIEELLEEREDWIVKAGRHYCSEECANK